MRVIYGKNIVVVPVISLKTEIKHLKQAAKVVSTAGKLQNDHNVHPEAGKKGGQEQSQWWP